MAAEFWPEDYSISITVAKGAPLDDAGSPNLLVVESDIPWWGAFRSVEFRYFRDGARVYDIGLSNMGVTERDGRLAVSLELREPSKNVVDHAYRIEADFHPKAGK